MSSWRDFFASLTSATPALFRKQPTLALILLWAAMVLFVAPHGAFAINDDWAFSTTVKWWSEDGFLRFTFWQAMTLIAQAFLGFLWSEAFGFSHFGLRLFSAVMAALFFVAGYGLARHCGLSKRVALLAPALYLAFPVFVMCSLTFMTDTTFFALAVAALFFFAMTLKNQRGWPLSYAAGLAFLVAAILTRQLGVFIAFGFAAGDIVANGAKPKIIARAGFAAALAVAVLAVYPIVIEPVAGLPVEYARRTSMLGSILADIVALKLGALKPMAQNLFWGGLYFGFLTIPLSAALLAARLGAREKRTLFASVAFGAGALMFAIAIIAGQPIPTAGNVLSLEGLGPRLVRPFAPDLPVGPFWRGLTALASLSAGVIIAELWRAVADRWREGRLFTDRREAGLFAMLIVAGVVGYLPYGIFYGPWFVRYIFLPGFCLLLVCAKLAATWEEALMRRRAVFAVFLVAGVAFSAVLARDFFTWSRARYALIDEAVSARGIDPEDLDGGFEYNNLRALLANPENSLTKKVVTGEGRRFVISKIPLDGYEILQSRKVGQIAPLGSDILYLLRASDNPAADAGGRKLSSASVSARKISSMTNSGRRFD